MSYWAKYLQIFVLGAFLIAGISPACAFISGKSWAEICGADGSVKQVEIDPDLLAYLPADEAPEDEHQLEQDCAFCFTHAKLDPLVQQESTNNPIPPSSNYVKFSNGIYGPSGQDLKPYESQAPPKTFV